MDDLRIFVDPEKLVEFSQVNIANSDIENS